MREILTLENVQVDCSKLTEEQIKKMADIYHYKGYYTNYNSLDIIDKARFLSYCHGSCTVYFSIENKTTISYEKFMELFSNKEENFKKLVEVLNEELTEKAYKEPQYEVKYIAEKPKQYQIGIDTFERCEANMTKEEILACVRFNIDKYTWRNKGQDLEDLEKIISYANWGIKQLKK